MSIRTPALVPAAVGLAALALAATGATVAATAAGSAHRTAPEAGREVVHDAAHDVLRADSSHHRVTAVPRVAAGDLTGLTTTYDAKQLRLALSMRATPTGHWALIGEVQTAEHDYDVVFVPYRGKTYVVLQNHKGSTQVECAGLRHTGGGTRDVAIVPASCLGDSPWVRTGAGSLTQHGSNGPSDFDDVRLRGRAARGGHLALGPKLHR